MLPQIKEILERGADSIPAIPAPVISYLQTVFSPSYQFAVGNVTDLKKSGWSEEYILGYLAGLESASQTIDQSIMAIEIDEDE